MKVLQTTNAPSASEIYAQGKIVNGLLFASGQLPVDVNTGEIVGDDITSQTEQVMKNVQAILSAAGVDLHAVVKTTCFLKDLNDFAAFNAAYAKVFAGDVPARSAFEVARLPKDVLVEIEFIAAVEQ
jgi:2-iminobutanoate/2-iminopropanoate deaminase